ncbi:outer membrane beta-barrel protein [Pyxidicoccus fallax]|uniref:Outer membrane beta-barrel protein n=1 Tax=Pyxidicoccus fallax TaxID=394095 RepID=A0A848LP51_9BACT|nr:outer membrane beta-barrel protein [Pyxidicoccus fallax]NMO19440.1 outer membrane beta-barrel protein [Pyxidicoccus fallax]NPC82734.1 outer membrane beta-barrel protein [Pyxidicoccus fallax]
MTGRLYKALAVTAALATSAASAQESTESTPATTEAPATTTMTTATSSEKSGLEIGVGLGFQAGAGYVYKNGLRLNGTVGDVKLSDAANGGIAFALDLGYRINSRWFAGLFGQYTYVLTKTNPLSCPEGFDCSTNQFRIGPQVQYHFAPDSGFDPFVGLGFGIVLLNTSIKSDNFTVQVPGVGGVPGAKLDIDSKTRGPEFINLTVGGRWNAGESFSFGPYLNATYARYTVRAGTQTVTLPATLPAPFGGATTEAPLGPVDDGPYGLIILGFRGTYTL